MIERYVFVEADTARFAMDWLESGLERVTGDVFEGFEVNADGVTRVKDVPPEVFERARHDAKNRKENVFMFITENSQTKAAGVLGHAYVEYGKILQEELCVNMPYFNIEWWSWDVPEDRDEMKPWFAVPVIFYF
jgi:hypothetical protein